MSRSMSPPRLEEPGSARAGLFYALAAYGSWGVLTLYFALLTHVPALVVVAHRVVWSVVFLGIVLAVQRRWREVTAALRSLRTVGVLALAASLIAVNWYVFIYAVATQQVLQASLGYYLNPLISVMLGMIVLRERLRSWQWISVALAAAGVVVAAAGHDLGLPWISLTLATSFALYGLVRKLAPVGPMVGLFIETVVLLLPAAALLLLGPDALPAGAGAGLFLLLMASGVVTAMPLVWFAAAVKRLPLATVGFLQYLAPTLQFALAVLVLGEHLDPQQLASFVLIWAGLALYTADAARMHRISAAAPVAVEMAE